MKRINTIQIDSLSEIIKKLESQKTNPSRVYLFRGQNVDSALIPKIARHRFRISRREDEIRMLNEFSRASKTMNSFQPTSELDRIIIAQHHGLPTRLLDWTENMLAALFFAVKPNNSGYPKESVLWVTAFDSKDRDVISDESEIRDPFKVEKVKFFQPSNLHYRITSQSSWFSIHPLKGTGFYTRADGLVSQTLKQTKITLGEDSVRMIYESLLKCGINDFSIFGDLDSLGTYIFSKYKKADQ